MSCDRFLRRTHAPRTSKSRFARTRARTLILWWSHFAPTPAPFSKLSNWAYFFMHFLKHIRYQNKVGLCKRIESSFYYQKKSKIGPFLPQNMRNCDRTSHTLKPAARTHIARTFWKPFRTHIAHVRGCAHVYVCDFFFATHRLLNKTVCSEMINTGKTFKWGWEVSTVFSQCFACIDITEQTVLVQSIYVKWLSLLSLHIVRTLP